MNATAKTIASLNRSSRPIFAFFFLALFLALQVFAGSDSLHKAIHHDAKSPGHQCVITLLSHGQVNVPVVTGIWLAFAAALIFSLPLLQAAIDSSLDLRLAPGRAPPRS